MSEIINKTDTGNTGEKTFTQEEVNRIVSERLNRERNNKDDKRAAELDEREKAIKARELAIIAAEKLAAAGLPKELSEIIKYDTEESLEAAINQLSGLKNSNSDTGEYFVIEPNKLREGIKKENDRDARLKNAFKFPVE